MHAQEPASNQFSRSSRAPRSGCAVSRVRVAGLASLIVLVSMLAACATTWREHERLVEPGMSEAEVLELLGEPSSRVKVPAWGERPAYVRWQWNDNLSTLATGAMFPDTVPDRVLAVSFDAEGKVSDIVLPRESSP